MIKSNYKMSKNFKYLENLTVASLQNIIKTDHLITFYIVVVVAHLGKLAFIDFFGLKHVHALLSEISGFLFEIEKSSHIAII